MIGASHSEVAVVLAAHGDRGGAGRNATLRALRAHTAAVARLAAPLAVTCGVLKGEPSLEDALREAAGAGRRRILVYPFFMADGYFASSVLPFRVRNAGFESVSRILAPLGLNMRLPDLLLAEALEAAQQAGIAPREARLVVAGHGSKIGPASARATESAASTIRLAARFASVETAFLEESPFLADAFENETAVTVVSGLFSGEGLHAGEDVPGTLRAAGATNAIYAGPIGRARRIPALIADALLCEVAAGCD
jgi:sirohydrochlorin ferrochelatase